MHNTILSLPFFEKDDIVVPAFSTKRLRIWKREWRNEKIQPEFCTKLRFRIAPANGRISYYYLQMEQTKILAEICLN